MTACNLSSTLAARRHTWEYRYLPDATDYVTDPVRLSYSEQNLQPISGVAVGRDSAEEGGVAHQRSL